MNSLILWRGWGRFSYFKITCSVIVGVLLITGCQPSPTALITPTPASSISTFTPPPEFEQVPTETATAPAPETNRLLGLTYYGLDGNRLIDGQGGSSNEYLDIQLKGVPRWVVSVPSENRSIWYVVLEDGQVQAFQLDGKSVLEVEPSLASLPPGMPPGLIVSENSVALIPLMPDSSTITHPFVLKDGTVAFIDKNGQVHLIRADVETVLPGESLPDARILSDENGRLLFLSGPTTSYPHGVLGDAIEATKISLVDTLFHPFSTNNIQIAGGEVIEGIAPIWVDIDDDGSREIIVTQSTQALGSRIVVYREDGSLFAQGEPIGQGFRWLHVLAVAQFIQGSSLEIAAIRTPHIGGVVEIYSLENDRLVAQYSISGYSSHQIGSRNLDSAFAADLNGDGTIELVVPDQSQLSLSALQFQENKVMPIWHASIGGKISTNLAVVNIARGKLAFGAGTENQTLRIWFFSN